MDNHFALLSMPDLKANISEENLLALTSISGKSSYDTTGLNLNRSDDASLSKLSYFSAALKKADQIVKECV